MPKAKIQEEETAHPPEEETEVALPQEAPEAPEPPVKEAPIVPETPAEDSGPPIPEDAPDETFCCVFISGNKSLMVHDTRLRT